MKMRMTMESKCSSIPGNSCGGASWLGMVGTAGDARHLGLGNRPSMQAREGGTPCNRHFEELKSAVVINVSINILFFLKSLDIKYETPSSRKQSHKGYANKQINTFEED